MKNFLRNYFHLFVFVFFVLFIAVLRFSDQIYSSFYSISLFILSIYLIGVMFLSSDCKIKPVRIAYKTHMIALALYLCLSAVKYIYINTLLDNIVFSYFYMLIIAICIVSLLASVFYTFRFFFKKNYAIQQFDFYNFKLLLSEMAFFAIIHVLLQYSISFKQYISGGSGYQIVLNSTPILTTLGIVSIIYIPCYFLIEYFSNKNKQPKM